MAQTASETYARDGRIDSAPLLGQTTLFWLLVVFLGLLTYGMTPLTNNLDEIKKSFFFCLMPILTVVYFVFLARGHCAAPPRSLNILLGGYFGVMIVSTLFSKHPWAGVYTIGFTVAAVGCYLGAVGAASRRDGLERTIFALVLICAGAIIFGLIHHFRFFDFLWWSIYRNQVPTTSSSPMHGLIYTFAMSDKEMFSTILNRDFYAAYLNMAIPLALALAIVTRSTQIRAVSLFTVGFGALSVILTMSKNDYVILAATPLLFFALYFLFIRLRSLRFPYWWIWVLGISINFGTLLFLRWTKFHTQLKLTAEGMLGAVESRRIIWDGAYRIFLDHPLLGSGPGSFFIVFPLYRDPDHFLFDISTVTLFAHNLFLDYLSETGALGFLFGFGFLVTIAGLLFWQIVKRGNRRLATLQAGLLCGLAAILVASMTSPHTRWPILAAHFYALLGIAAAAINLGRDPDAFVRGPAPRGGSSVNRVEIAGFSLATISFILAALLFTFGFRYFIGSMANNDGLRYLPYQHDAGRQEKAAEYFEEAIEWNPTFITSYYKAGHAYHSLLELVPEDQKEKYLEKSYNAYKRLQRYAPDYSEIHFNLGLLHQQRAFRAPTLGDQRDELAMAVDEYEEAARQSNHLRTQMSCANSHQELASVLLRLNDLKGARQHLVRAVEIYEKLLTYDRDRSDVADRFPSGDPNLQLTRKNYGLLLYEIDRYDEAVDALYDYLLDYPGDHKASDALARAMSEIDDTARVENILLDLIRSNPLRVDYRIYLFKTYQKMKLYDQAWEHVQAALRIVPGERRSLIAEGEILIVRNQIDKARESLVRAAQGPINDNYVMRARALLKQLDELEKKAAAAP